MEEKQNEQVNKEVKAESMTKKILNLFVNDKVVSKKDLITAFPTLKYPSIRLTQLKREGKIEKVKGGYTLKKTIDDKVATQ